jgi:multidrug efflux system outer membrane protein
MGPDYQRPDTGLELPDAFENEPSDARIQVPKDRWWEAFRNSEIDRLVDEAIRNNWDIKKAAARILEVRAQFVQTRADRYPNLDANLGVRTQLVPIVGVIPGETLVARSDVYELSFPASFEVDLWGRLARAQEAARADLLQAVENRTTVAQGVIAEAIGLYLEMESLERGIQVTERSIRSFRRNVELVESRYKRGLTSILDLRQARRILAQAEAFLPLQIQELGTTQQSLTILLGRYPETRQARPQRDDYYKRLDPVPTGLPSELLLRRPDIRAAEARLAAANARVGVARASRFPRISLTGALGIRSAELRDLFLPESRLYELGLGLAQPLFDAGRLKAGEEGARARYQQEVAEYANTVLQAFAEVEGALLTRQRQLERRERFLVFLTESRATQRIAEMRYERGLGDYLSVLEAQQTRFEAEQNVIGVELTILANRVRLHRALGGGWPVLGPVEGEDYFPPVPPVASVTEQNEVTK